jgi:TetR/AcrR family transcriptional regulator, cholesterol catabolism regulator
MATNNRKTDRRKQIIEIAARIFADKGYHSATLDDIAAELNLTKASLYYYITSKKAVLEEICNIVGKTNVAAFDDIVKSDMTPREKVKALIFRQITTNAENKEICSVYFDVSESVDPKAYRKIKGQLKAGEKALQLILQEGVEKGYFAIEDVKMASFLIFSACNRIPKWYHPGGRLTPEEIAEQFTKLLENGFLASK